MKTAVIQVGSGGPNVVVPGSPGRTIAVYAFSLHAPGDFVDSAIGVKWQSSSGKDLTGYRYLTPRNLAWDFGMAEVRPAGRTDAYFSTLPGEGLALFLQSGFDLQGFVCYEIVGQ
jgi:hypothetical protein